MSVVLRRILPRAAFAVASRAPACRTPLVAQRFFASTAGSKVSHTLQAEIKHEDEQYEVDKEIKKFLDASSFKLADTPGDVNMCLEREAGDKVVRVEWQLTGAFDANADMEGGEGEAEQEPTDFCVTVTDTSAGSGLAFYCSTQIGQDHRYVIGNVRSFLNKEESEAVSGYNGPEFEDLDDKVQEALDEYLAELGMNTAVCDFMDAMAVDKEQREYIRWLKNVEKFTC